MIEKCINCDKCDSYPDNGNCPQGLFHGASGVWRNSMLLHCSVEVSRLDLDMFITLVMGMSRSMLH